MRGKTQPQLTPELTPLDPHENVDLRFPIHLGKSLYSRTDEVDRVVVDCVGEVSERRGVSLAQVALAWMLGKPAIAAPPSLFSKRPCGESGGRSLGRKKIGSITAKRNYTSSR